MKKPVPPRQWTIKKAWKVPGTLSLARLYEDKADAEFADDGTLEQTVIPVSIVITELPVPAKKTKGKTR